MASARPVALITGASSGIGAAFARALAGRGYDLILVARREERLRAQALELQTKSEIVSADLSSDQGIAAVANKIRETPIDLLINNAGFGTRGRFWETDFAGQEQMHVLHVMATMRLTRAALEGMVARKSGAVINVSSVAAYGTNPGNVSYCATKAWMNSFTEGIDAELRGIGSPVKVQALCPGYTTTEFHDTLEFDRARIPKILWTRVEDVVEASLRGLERGPTIVIPKAIYQLAAAAMKVLPGGLIRRIGRPGGDRV
jgi:short-subunit dehydrogenase